MQEKQALRFGEKQEVPIAGEQDTIFPSCSTCKFLILYGFFVQEVKPRMDQVPGRPTQHHVRRKPNTAFTGTRVG